MDLSSWDWGAVGDVPERTAAAALGTRRRAPHPEARLGAHIVLLLLLGAADPARVEGGDVHPERLRADEPALVLHPRQGAAQNLEEVRMLFLTCSVSTFLYAA